MDYKHLGYFVAVCIIVFGSVITWWLKMFLTERKLLNHITLLDKDVTLSEEEK